MSTFKLTIRGIAIEVSTAADALELIRLAEVTPGDTTQTASAPRLQAPAAAAGTNGRPPVQHSTRVTTHDPTILKFTGDFLRTVQSNGRAGVPTDKIITALGVPHGRAIGGRLAIINKTLQERGFGVKEIYSNKKTRHGRTWKPMKSIDTAIATVEQQLRALQ